MGAIPPGVPPPPLNTTYTRTHIYTHTHTRRLFDFLKSMSCNGRCRWGDVSRTNPLFMAMGGDDLDDSIGGDLDGLAMGDDDLRMMEAQLDAGLTMGADALDIRASSAQFHRTFYRCAVLRHCRFTCFSLFADSNCTKHGTETQPQPGPFLPVCASCQSLWA